jgi:hypothetical protein
MFLLGLFTASVLNAYVTQQAPNTKKEAIALCFKALQRHQPEK